MLTVSKTTHLNAYVRPAKSTWVPHFPVRSAEDVETVQGHALWIASYATPT